MSFQDPEILQDFLTESGELLEELDADLVTLEDSADDSELLNKVFRALHTIGRWPEINDRSRCASSRRFFS